LFPTNYAFVEFVGQRSDNWDIVDSRDDRELIDVTEDIPLSTGTFGHPLTRSSGYGNWNRVAGSGAFNSGECIMSNALKSSNAANRKSVVRQFGARCNYDEIN